MQQDMVQPSDDHQNQMIGNSPPASVRPYRPVGDAPRSGGTGGGLANRPPGYPNAIVWLRVGILRDWRGVLGSFIAAWFYVPVALFNAVVLAAVAGIALAFTGGGLFADLIPDQVRDAPIVGRLVSSFMEQSGGAIGAFVGAGIAFLAGLLMVPILRFGGVDSGVSLIAQLAGIVAAAILVGVLYTLYRVLFEHRLLRVSGARELSRRERELIMPILHECAERLGLPGVPRLLVEDDLVSTNARTYARHIVVTTGLLTDPRDEIAALLSHELVHWRTGDEITSAFVRGVGLPLVLVHAVPTWLMRKFPHPATNLFVFVFFWPVLLTMKYLVQPLHRADVRAAEYRADLGAVVTGRTEELRAILERRKSFESGRSGWDEAVCAEHPPNELRLERLETVRAGHQPSAPEEPPRRVIGTEELFGGDDPLDLRRPAVIGGVVLLSFCLISSLLGIVQWSLFRPEAAVNGYFSALADRDVDDLAGWLSPEIEATVRNDTLLAELIKSTDYQPPKNVDIRDIERDDDLATAKVSFDLGEIPVETEVMLRRDEDSTLGVFKGWHVLGGVFALTVAADQAGLMINGVSVPTSPQEQTVRSVPGMYVVTAASNPLSEVAPQYLTVLPGYMSETLIQAIPELKPAAQGAIQAQVRAYLDECARQTVAAPQGCPFRLSGYSSAENITWKIISYPEPQIEILGPTAARLSTPYEGQGQAEVSGTYESYFGKDEFTERRSITVTGVVTVTGDELTFQPDVEE